MQDCVFCKIINREIPADTIYENEQVLAFLDISPTNPGHTLIIPKAHHETILDCPLEIQTAMMKTLQLITPAILKAVNSDGFNINVNTKPVAGQVVPHYHLHIIPRHEGDGLELWHGKSYKEGEAEDLVEAIKNAL